MSIVTSTLSKEALAAIEAYEDGLNGLVEVLALRESGSIWGVKFKYKNPEGIFVSEETVLTTRGSSRRAAQFVVGFHKNGTAPDEGDWMPIWLSTPSKTLSEFVIKVIEEGITPSAYTVMVADLVKESTDGEDVCEIDDEGDEDEEEETIEAAYPCSECEDINKEEVCTNCPCNECEDDDCEGCEDNPVSEEDTDDNDDSSE